MKPIHKFNGGIGATLCHVCRVIISTGFTQALYCDKCKPNEMENNKQKIDATDAPPQGAIEWLVKTLNEKVEFIPLEKWDEIRDVVQEAKQIQKHMVMHAYNFGWDDGFYKIQSSMSDDADENFYNEFYGKQ